MIWKTEFEKRTEHEVDEFMRVLCRKFYDYGEMDEILTDMGNQAMGFDKRWEKLISDIGITEVDDFEKNK